MNAKTFEELVQKLQIEEVEILKTKGRDYTQGGEDRLKNFKAIADELGADPMVIVGVYFLKHIDSIKTYIQTSDLRSEGFKSRVLDARNYLALMLALAIDLGRPVD
jgi:7-cyano-7-deazaguanine synthase in queuosine biosynthesis